MREIGRNMPDGSALPLDVEQGDAALGGGVELEDLRDAESIFERVPDFRGEAVATGQADAVLGLAR